MIHKKDVTNTHFYQIYENGKIIHIALFKEDREFEEQHGDVFVTQNIKKGDWIINNQEQLPKNQQLISCAKEEFDLCLKEIYRKNEEFFNYEEYPDDNTADLHN
jgi:hypothetical protein